jgi:hypothetical protein
LGKVVCSAAGRDCSDQTNMMHMRRKESVYKDTDNQKTESQGQIVTKSRCKREI